MTANEFQTQIARMASTFGKVHFSPERVQLVWGDVGSLNLGWFRAVCDDMIATERHAPMPAAFSLAASEERERLWKIDKAKGANETKGAMKSLFGPSDISMLCKSVMNRIEGKMNDDAFKAFNNLFKDMPSPRACCTICDDSGYVFRREEENECVSRCICNEGAMKPSGIPRMVTR